MSEGDTVDIPIEVDPPDAAALVAAGNAILVDCREPFEYDLARIDGALLMPMREIPERLEEIAAHVENRLIVHCHHGVRSLRVAAYLRQAGFGRAQSMRGGIDAWSRQVDGSVPQYTK